MAEKLERKVMEIYGENAATRDIIAYGSDIAGNIVETKDPDVIQTEAYKTGVRSAVVGNNSTTLQNRQALDFLFSRQLKYLYQQGIPEWGAEETYYKSSVVRGSDGNLYGSITDNNVGHNPVEDTLHTNWRNFPTYNELEAKVNKSGDTMTGQLTMANGSNGIVFEGPNNNKYYVHFKENNLYFLHDDIKGLAINSIDNFRPYYIDGTSRNKLALSSEIPSSQNVVNWTMPDYDSEIEVTLPYTVPVDGYISYSGRSYPNNNLYVAINGRFPAPNIAVSSQTDFTLMFPVRAGDVITTQGGTLSVTRFYKAIGS